MNRVPREGNNQWDLSAEAENSPQKRDCCARLPKKKKKRKRKISEIGGVPLSETQEEGPHKSSEDFVFRESDLEKSAELPDTELPVKKSRRQKQRERSKKRRRRRYSDSVDPSAPVTTPSLDMDSLNSVVDTMNSASSTDVNDSKLGQKLQKKKRRKIKNDTSDIEMAVESTVDELLGVSEGEEGCQSTALLSKSFEQLFAKDNGPTEVPFEVMFNNDKTQAAAWEHYKLVVAKAKSNQMDQVKRTQLPRNVNLKKQEKIVASKNTLDHGGDGNSEEYESDDAKITLGDGDAMVTKLMDQYKVGRKNARPQQERSRKVISDTDDSDLDENILDDDYQDEMEGSTGFVKYSIPQYEIKTKLYEMHYNNIKLLEASEIDRLCRMIIPKLHQIKNEETYSARHQLFKNIGINKTELKKRGISQPFHNSFNTRLVDLISDQFYPEEADQENGEILHYMNLVLLPEALIGIYASVNKIDCDLAEKELLFKAAYGGELPEDVISTVSDAEVKFQQETPHSSTRYKHRNRFY